MFLFEKKMLLLYKSNKKTSGQARVATRSDEESGMGATDWGDGTEAFQPQRPKLTPNRKYQWKLAKMPITCYKK